MQTETEDNESSNRCQGVSDICRFAESALQEAEKLRFSHNLSIVVTLFVGVNLNGTKLTRLLDENNYVEREILAFRSFCTSMYTIDKDFHTEFVLVDAPDRHDRELLYNVLEPHIEQIPKTCHFKFVRVSNEFLSHIPNPQGFRFPEYIVKNIGIRRANGEWILARNNGIVLNLMAIQAVHGILRLSSDMISKRFVYRLDRFDLKAEHIDSLVTADGKLLLKCENGSQCTLPSILTKEPYKILNLFDDATMFNHEPSKPQFYASEPTEEGKLSCSGEPPPIDSLMCVPPWDVTYDEKIQNESSFEEISHCQLRPTLGWAAGDFILGYHTFWNVSSAFPNFYGMAGVDSLMICRIAGSCFVPIEIAGGSNYGCGAVHLPHERSKEHMVLLDDDDVRTNRQLADIPYCRAELCGLRGTSRLQIGERSDWGFPNIKFPEKVIRGRGKY